MRLSIVLIKELPQIKQILNKINIIIIFIMFCKQLVINILICLVNIRDDQGSRPKLGIKDNKDNSRNKFLSFI